MKTAIIQMSDTGPFQSTASMLKVAGYDSYLPNDELLDSLRRTGCDTIISHRAMVDSWGYERLEFPQAGPKMMEECDLYCDVKAHRNGNKVIKRWPNLKNRVLWTRINGGQPEHCINARGDHGDELNPAFPILTPNLWYDLPQFECDKTGQMIQVRVNQRGAAYAMWPPFVRFGDYFAKRSRPWRVGREDAYADPFCLVHNLSGWGYGPLADPIRGLGVKLYGVGSPDGLVNHRDVPRMLSQTLAYVHLKSNDAPGYALYEALAAACPVICARKLIWKCRMQELLVPGETCLVFDLEGHQGWEPRDVEECVREVKDRLNYLKDPTFNLRIGLAGYDRLKQLMWNEERDGAKFVKWMRKNFGG